MIIEKIYNASADLVWQALTNREQMKQWYFELDGFKAEEGFHFTFPGQGTTGEKYLHHCTITRIIPHKILQYSWAYEGYPGSSLVTFDLEEAGEKTKLTLTHVGHDSFPASNPDFAPNNFQEGWNYLLGVSLPEFLQKQD